MPANKISIDNAKPEKLFYFVANVVIYREEDQRCLILKRDPREKVHPGKWATPGGKQEWSDMDMAKPTRINGEVIDFENAVEDLLKREVKEEANIEIEDQLVYLNSVAFVRPDETPVVLVKFAAKYKGGEVVPEKGAFTDFAWVDSQEVKKYNCIDGIFKEIEQAIGLFKK